MLLNVKRLSMSQKNAIGKGRSLKVSAVVKIYSSKLVRVRINFI